MIAAAKASPLELIDKGERYCDGDVTVGAWLSGLTQGEAKSVAWTAGPCDPVNASIP